MAAWRSTLVITVSSVVLLAVGAIWLGGASAQPRADLAGSSGDGPGGELPAAVQASSDPPAPASGPEEAAPEPAGDPAAALEVPVAPAAPTGLVIPSLGVFSPVVPVGLESDGSMELPGASEAGWYEPGRLPGSATGSAVIAAHVDFNEERGVFFELRRIEPGAEVSVADASGRTHRFVVTERFQLPKEQVPMDELFRTGGDPVLTLVTCGGAFEPSARSYQDNIVVRAVPVPA